MSNRGNFSGQIGFILAATGSAVGLSNIWRFPYLTGQNGGAVFLIIYVLCIFLFCFPVLVGEIAIGRAGGKDAYGSYKKLGNKKWGWLGLGGIISGIFILSYYNLVAGWAFGYFFEIVFFSALSETDHAGFFSSFISNMSSSFIYAFVFLFLTAACVVQGIQKGIEKLNKILMPSLLIVLLGLIAYALTLPRAMEGITFYLVPDFSAITKQTLFDALRLSFFTLSIGVGGLITYGSYLDKGQNIVRSSAIVTMSDTTVAFLAGLMIFPLVFSAGKSPTEGPALVFIVLPEIFKGMGPLLGRIVGGAFFLLLCFATLSSCVSLLELAIAYFIDEKKLPRKKIVWIVAAVIFIIGIPSTLSFGDYPIFNKLSFYKDRDFFTLVADVTDISLTVGGCLMCLFIRNRWKMVNLNQELTFGNPGFPGSFVQRYINFAIGYLCPTLLAVLSALIIIDKIFGI
ncbi:MAG TPA: sodium-dependent transporter [Chryseosolibacter sp.]|nr:sodium-dependent transporter [Chryseosolibacter sp.]